MRRISSILLIPIVLAAGACGDSMHIPAPSSGQAARAVPEPEPSTITLPVTVSLASVAAQVEALVPKGEDHEDEWRPVGKAPVVGTVYVKELWERDPLALQIHGDHVDVAAHVRYRARVATRACLPIGGCRFVPLAGCGQDAMMPSLDIGLRTSLAWSADWTLTPRTTPSPVAPGVPCLLTGARIDVTDRVRTAVASVLAKAAPRIDEKIRAAAAVRRRVEGVWSALQKPIRAGSDAYLLLQPEAVAATPPRGSGTTLSTTVSVTVRPKVVIGADQPAAAPRPLPRGGVVGPGRGFRVQIVAELPMDAANEILAKSLAGRTFVVKGHRVRVRDARMYAGGTRVVLPVVLSGDAKGTVYFVGTPQFDPLTREVSVPDLDFSVESRQVLPQVAGWLLYDQLRDDLRKAARFSVGERVDRIHAQVDSALNRPLGRDVRMSGGVDALRPLGVYVVAQSLAAVVEADGHLRIAVDVHARPRRGPRDGSDDGDDSTDTGNR